MENSAVFKKNVCTQAQLAEELGVSQVTVFKSLSGHPKVSQAVREKVLRLAQKRGYRVNTSARAMRQKRFGAIALMQSIELSRSVIFKQSLHAIQIATQKHQLHVLLGELPDEQLTSSGYVPKLLNEWMCDGLLLNYISGVPQQMIELIARYHLPSVWMNFKQASNSIYPNDLAGARVATEHLLKLGHRRIAYADYIFRDLTSGAVHYSAVDRHAGYLAAMKAAGLQPRVIRLPQNVHRNESAAFSAQWLKSEDRPTAVLTYNSDTVKPVVFGAMAIAGFKVPQDLSVITVDERVFTEFGFPLTTMVLPGYEMGAESVEMLIECIASPGTQLPAKPLDLRLESGELCLPPIDSK